MKISMTLMLALLLSGCGKKAEVGSETSVEMSYSNYEALTTNTPTDLPPTIVLIAEDISGIKLVKSIQGNFNFNFPNGFWKFYIMSWNWATPSNGGAPFLVDATAPQSELFCGYQNAVNLTGQPVTIQMSLSKANCESADSNLNIGRFRFIYNETPPGTTHYSVWSIIGYNALTGESEGEIFKTSCEPLNATGKSSPLLPVPKLNLPIKFKFKIVVRIFNYPSCPQDTLQYSLIYPDSLRSNPVKIRHASNPVQLSFSLKLESQNLTIGDPIILNSSITTKNSSLSIAEAAIDDIII